MDDPSRPLRRISKAYIFGLTSKPFKYEFPHGPRPAAQPSTISQPNPQPAARKPKIFAQIAPQPGDMTEWIASDGRRGAITGTSKVRRFKQVVSQHSTPTVATAIAATNKAADTATTQAASAPAFVPPAVTACAPTPTPKETDANEEIGGLFGLFDESSTDAKPAVSKPKDKEENKDGENPHSFTAGEDKQLLEWKNKNPSGQWATIGEKFGRQGWQCKERFNQIKPKDWKPMAASGGESSGKKSKGKGKKQEQSVKHDTEKKKNMRKTGWNDQPSGSDNAAGWGAQNWGNNDDDKNGDNNVGFERNDTQWAASNDLPLVVNNATWDVGTNNNWDSSNIGGGNADNGKASGWNDNNNTWGGNDSGWDNRNTWDDNAIGDGDGSGWNNKDNTSAAAGWQSTPNQDKNSKDRKSHRSHSKSHRRSSHGRESESKSESKPTRPTTKVPVEVTPDKIFSGQDLRVLARILQRDSAMVWQRASYRFKDSTGRDVPPEVIRRKIKGIKEDGGEERDGSEGKKRYKETERKEKEKEERKQHREKRYEEEKEERNERKEKEWKERQERKESKERKEREEREARDRRGDKQKSQEWGPPTW